MEDGKTEDWKDGRTETTDFRVLRNRRISVTGI